MSSEVSVPGAESRERIYAAFADRTQGFDDTIEQALDIGSTRLGAEFGFLTRIDDDTQRILHAVGDHDLIQPGETCPLDDAYCKRTLRMDEPLTVHDARTSERVDPGAFETFGLCQYIGTKVFVDGEVFGTICFAGREPRATSFTESDELFVELVSGLVSQALERRRYEQRLKARSARLRTEKERFEDIAETTFDVIYRINPQARFTYVSSASKRIVGYDPEELIGEPFGDYIESSSIQETLDAFHRVYRGELVENLELEFRAGDGGVVVLEINVSPIFENGEVVEIQGVARDVTERRERDVLLRIQNRAIEDSQVGITIAETTGEDRSIVFANDAFEDLTGYSRAEIAECKHRSLTGERTDPETIRAFEESIGRRESLTAEILNYRKDGVPYWARSSVSPVLDTDGEMTHAVQFHEDITERERTYRLVELFNRVLRHNLRNDMNVILGYGELLSDPDLAEEASASIRRTANALIEFSERMYELEQYTHSERRPARLDPAAILADIAERSGEVHPESTVEYSVETDRDICAGRELEQAVSELVTNALVHNESPTNVSVTVADAGAQLEITVRDDGVGVSPKEVAFVQSGRETALEHGSSLGLWFVNWIVTRYGGSFQITPVQATDETGTVARILIRGIDDDTSVEDAVQAPTPLFR